MEQQHGRPARAVRVTIPGRGEFYRVVLVGFESAAAAWSYRAEAMPGAAATAAIYWLVPLP